LIVDAQSVKNTDTAGSKGYDAGKKVSGIKRHIAVDTQGLPHAIAVTTAEVTDRKGALQALQRCKPALSRVQALLCDSGYVGRPFAQGVQHILGGHVAVQIAKRSELHTLAVLPQPPILLQPGKAALDDPALGHHLERMQFIAGGISILKEKKGEKDNAHY
jgi:hypothetical protein